MIDDLVSDVTSSPPVRRVFYPRLVNFLKLATTYTDNARDHGGEESGLRVATATRTSLAYQNRIPDAEIPVQRVPCTISAQLHFSFASPLPTQFPHRWKYLDPPPTDKTRLNSVGRIG